MALADLFTLPRRKAFSLQRATGRIASLEKPHAVTLTLVNHSSRPQQHQRSATACRTNCGPSRMSSRCSWTAAAGRCCATCCGPAAAAHSRSSGVFLLARSRLGFWQRLLDYPAGDDHPRLSRLAAVGPVRAAGPHEPAQPAGRAADAENRPGPRIRAAPRLHASTTITSGSTGGRPPGETSSPFASTRPRSASRSCSSSTAGG